MTASNTTAIPAAGPPEDVLDQVIPVVEEVATIGKRTVESGRVRVRITVDERDETIETLLKHQNATIERVPVGRVVAESPGIRSEGDTIIVPVLEEVLVTETRLVLKEELHIRIAQTEHTETRHVRLRAEQATIEDSTNPRKDLL